MASTRAAAVTNFRRPQDGVAAGDAMPFFWNGEYHIFHLTCPPNTRHLQYPERVRTSWRHIVSRDLAHWEELPVAIPPGDDGPDADGSWTGSVIERNGTFHAYYTGHRVGVQFPQTICHATSTDLVRFEKDRRNPIVVPDLDVYENVDWRDPYVFWNEREGAYWMLLAARLNSGPVSRRGCVVLVTSPDLQSWSKPELFYAPYATYCPECPEMFELGDKWYLVYSRFSEDGQTIYRVGDGPRGPWRSALHEGIDGRRVYAAKSLSDGKRRLIWGTVYERTADDNDADWLYGGDFSVGRELVPTDGGELAVRCPPEVVADYTVERPVQWGEARGGWQTSDRSAAVTSTATMSYILFDPPSAEYVLDVEITPEDVRDYCGVLLKATSDLERAFGLVLEPGAQRVVITLWPQPLDPFWAKLTGHPVPPPQVDGPRLVEHELEIRDGRPISCRILVTGSIVEAFVDDEVALTYRIYDDHDFKPGLIVQDGAARFDPIRLRTRAG